MAMTTAEYEAFVSRLNEDAKRNPAGYKWRVVLLALLGYGYVGFMFLIILALTVAAVVSIVYLKAIGIKLAFGLIIFLYFVVKAMFVRVTPPEGRKLTRREAPALFEMVDKVRDKLGAPPFHRVLIDNDFNAGVVQVPRLGIFGWHQNYLLIGLPLLKALTVEQFEAVLAHEFGHLSGGHAKLSNWIYRLRMGWQRLVALLEYNRSWGSFMFRPFFNWYAPYFAGYSFPLARLNEYEADNASSRLTSPQAAAQALTAVNVVGRYLNQKFWPDIHKQAETSPQPAFAPYSKISDQLALDLQAATTQEWLEQSMKHETNIGDTHPSLKDRLSALGQPPALMPPAPGKGADLLLGPALEAITSELDKRWKDAVSAPWQKRYQEVQDGRKRLEELTDLGKSRELTVDELFEFAKLTEAFGDGADAALDQFKALQTRAPERAIFLFALAIRLLTRNDPAGVPLMERAMQLDEEALAPGCEALRDFHWRAGRKDEAYTWNDRLSDGHKLLNEAALERSEVRPKDKFTLHELSAETIDELRAQFAAITELRKVYFLRKSVQRLKDKPLYVCAFTMLPWWKTHNAKKAKAMRERVSASIKFPGETLILCADGTNSAFEKKFRKIRGSRLI